MIQKFKADRFDMAVMLLISRTWVFFCLLIVTLPTTVHADEPQKVIEFNCDEANNKFLARFGTTYEDAPLPRVSLPNDLKKEYEYLNKAERKKECAFSNKQKIEFFPAGSGMISNGPCGGDPSAGFTFKINDKNVFYKFNWDEGRCDKIIDPFILLYDGESLISCSYEMKDELENTKTIPFKIQAESCQDISGRLTEKLKSRELIAYNIDNRIINIKKSLDADICNPLAKRDYLDIQQKDFVEFSQSGMFEPERMYKAKIDINNNGIKENIYSMEGSTPWHTGNYLIFFDDKKSESDFQSCMLENKCPKDFQSGKHSPRGQFDIRTAGKYWPDIHPVTTKLLASEIINKESYNHIDTKLFAYKGKIYVYFRPSNPVVQPYEAIGFIRPDSKMETVCIYGYEP